MLARASISPDIEPGEIFIPMHWTNQLSSQSRAGALANPVTDPESGQPEPKHTPARVYP